MTMWSVATCWVSVVVSLGLALAAMLGGRRSVAAWCFAAGMVVMAADGVLTAMSLGALTVEEAGRWQRWWLWVKALVPAPWLAFSLVYARGDFRDYLRRWWWVLMAAVVLPVVVGGLLWFGPQPAVRVGRVEGEAGWHVMYAGWSRWLRVVLVAAAVGVLANLERTFRAAVGTMQWRIKYVVLGLGLIFGAEIYGRVQGLIFSTQDLDLRVTQQLAVIMGCGLMVIGHGRHAFAEIDIYPSRTVLQGSVVVVLVGAYLFVVGVLAQVARHLGGFGSFQLQALVVLAGVVGLAVLLLSERLRQQLRLMVSRHFRRPQHDYRKVWMQCARRLSLGLRPEAYHTEAVRLVAGTFNALSVTLWLFDEGRDCLVVGASTHRPDGGQEGSGKDEAGESEEEEDAPGTAGGDASGWRRGLRMADGPFDLDAAPHPWVAALRPVGLRHFRHSGTRICLPLRAGGHDLGFMILADRVNGVSYSVEEMDLLRCLGDHVAAGLLQHRLTEELMHGRELEAFQAMSTFFVHDLKNAASSLGLMLQNLPEHFDDPEFRADALRGIGSTAGRINQIIERLGSLRQKLELQLAATDLKALVEDCLTELGGLGGVTVIHDLREVPTVRADRDQLATVVTNLLLNAREAVGADGRITVSTGVADGQVFLAVSDNGSGMSREFIRTSLFRPFQTTKKKGLGIGLFQSKLIVEAHHGVLQVQSVPGAGTTFRLLLPLNATPHEAQTADR